MKVKVNGELISLFAGATVADAVRKYLRTAGETAKNADIPPVRDRYGHEIAPDGELSEGDELVLENGTRGKGKS